MTPTLDARLTSLTDQVDDWLRPYVEGSGETVQPLNAMMAYHLGWAAADGAYLDRPIATGKRLRPLLVVLVCEALSGATQAAQGPAVAVELVHNFSLVHDDIQDESEYRRGRRTVWRLWGAPQAINVGDGLFALAQLALVEHGGTDAQVARAVRALNSSCVRLVEGQFLDLRLESVVDVSLDEYAQMIGKKTAALIECACVLGAIAADADEDTIARCGHLGHQLGLAFQYQDDVLGVWGDPSITGKPAGADIRSRKKGLPMVLALKRAADDGRDDLRTLLAGERPLDDRQVGQVLRQMDELGIRDQAQALADAQFVTVERAILAALPAGREHDLVALCRRLRARLA